MRPTWPAGLTAPQLDGHKDQDGDQKDAAPDPAQDAHHRLQVHGRVPPALAVWAGLFDVGLGLFWQRTAAGADPLSPAGEADTAAAAPMHAPAAPAAKEGGDERVSLPTAARFSVAGHVRLRPEFPATGAQTSCA